MITKNANGISVTLSIPMAIGKVTSVSDKTYSTSAVLDAYREELMTYIKQNIEAMEYSLIKNIEGAQQITQNGLVLYKNGGVFCYENYEDLCRGLSNLRDKKYDGFLKNSTALTCCIIAVGTASSFVETTNSTKRELLYVLVNALKKS